MSFKKMKDEGYGIVKEDMPMKQRKRERKYQTISTEIASTFGILVRERRERRTDGRKSSRVVYIDLDRKGKGGFLSKERSFSPPKISLSLSLIFISPVSPFDDRGCEDAST